MEDVVDLNEERLGLSYAAIIYAELCAGLVSREVDGCSCFVCH